MHGGGADVGQPRGRAPCRTTSTSGSTASTPDRRSTTGHRPLVVSGDCTTSLGVLAGLQRSGHDDGVVWLDAWDTDPGDHVLLERSAIGRVAVPDLDVQVLPDGELHLHVDVDVTDPRDVPDLLHPTSGGPGLDEVLAAVQRVTGTGRVAAVGVAATWRHRGTLASAHEQLLRRLRTAVS